MNSKPLQRVFKFSTTPSILPQNLMQPYRADQVDLNADIAWTPGGMPRAYLYLLDGRTHLVAHRSSSERRLLERGAFPVAVLSFDRPAATPPEPEVAVRRLGVGEAVGWFARWVTAN